MENYNFVEHDKQTHKSGKKFDEERAFKITTLYVEEQKTLGEIGKEFGLSRERIRQIINKVVTKEQLLAIKESNAENRRANRTRKIYKSECKQCGIELENFLRAKVFCSTECRDTYRGEQKKRTYKKRIESINKWQKENKDKIKIYNKKRYEKLKSDPQKWEEYKKKARDYRTERYKNDPEFRERLLKSYKESLERRAKKDPDFFNKRRKYQRNRLKKLKENPEKWDEYSEKQRIKSREYYQKIKNLRKKYDPSYKERSSIFFTN